MTAQALSEPMHEEQRHPGRTRSCCGGMKWAVDCGYIHRGFFWRKTENPFWVCWRLQVGGVGWYDVSPIHFCPFCGQDLDAPEGT
jgi:hypothetical protein